MTVKIIEFMISMNKDNLKGIGQDHVKMITIKIDVIINEIFVCLFEID